jgi:hypothetical protein
MILAGMANLFLFLVLFLFGERHERHLFTAQGKQHMRAGTTLYRMSGVTLLGETQSSESGGFGRIFSRKTKTSFNHRYTDGASTGGRRRTFVMSSREQFLFS